jgi:predicted nucleotide-binding protein
VATKLKLFIGSSAEALDYANAIQENLDRDADCTVWTQGVFGLSRTTFAELLKKLSSFDCAIFVF